MIVDGAPLPTTPSQAAEFEVRAEIEPAAAIVLFDRMDERQKFARFQVEVNQSLHHLTERERPALRLEARNEH